MFKYFLTAVQGLAFLSAVWLAFLKMQYVKDNAPEQDDFKAGLKAGAKDFKYVYLFIFVAICAKIIQTFFT